MEESHKIDPRDAGNVVAALVLLVAGFVARYLYDDAAQVTAGDMVAFVLWSLAAAVVARTLIIRLW